VEDDSGQSLGQATALDAVANSHRTRRKSTPADPAIGTPQGANLIEIALARHYGIKGPGANDRGTNDRGANDRSANDRSANGDNAGKGG
jgi:hypothetical protein